MPGWFDEQGITGYEPIQQPQGQAGAELGAPQQQAATWAPGAKAGQRVTLLGFDTDKLLDPSSGSVAGSKYTPAAKAFAAGLSQDVGLSRGGLDNMLAYLKANGFENATSDGKQKIDFGDGNGLIDVIRSDGQIVFQNTIGNPTWEGKGYKPDHATTPMPTLGSIGQAPGGAFNPTGVDIGTQAPPTLDQFSDALQATAPPQAQPMAAQPPQMYDVKTMAGPEAMKLKVPGFASGVQDFSGGPAIVGERGPELLNLPKGSDVIPFGGGPQSSTLPPIGSAGMTLGGGGQMPALGGSGAINFGNGGGLPPIGQAGGGPMTLGGWGGLPPIGQPQGQPQGAPEGQGGGQSGGYTYNPMAAPPAYNPQNVAGPDRLSLGAIGQTQAQGGGPVTAGMVQPGQQVNAERVQGQTIDAPGQVNFERVQGPQALQAQQLGPAQQQANLTAEQLPLDPSYQFRRDETLGALENSAFAKGMGFHPNAIRGQMEAAGNLASQEYAAANARNLGVQQQNFQNQATVAGANNAANANAYGLTNQYQQQAALANQSAGLQSGMFNSQQAQQAQQFNAGQNQQAALANQQAGLSAGQFNSGQQQQANLANVGNQLQAGQFNSAQGQQNNQFNAQQNFQTQQANIGNQLAAYNAYQPLAQQNSQFNAGRTDAANQNNFANAFSVNQANNAGSLGAFNANLGAELGRGNLALGNRSADQSFANAQGQLALGNRSADQSYDLGLRANALGNRQADQSYGLGLGNLGVSQGQLGLAQQGQQYNQDLNTFNTNYGVYRDNRDTAFNQGTTLAGIGANAAQNYGNQAGAYYSGQGNANGAAAINQGNAYAGALGNIGNIAGQAGAYYGNPQQPYNGAQPWRNS